MVTKSTSLFKVAPSYRSLVDLSGNLVTSLLPCYRQCPYFRADFGLPLHFFVLILW